VAAAKTAETLLCRASALSDKLSWVPSNLKCPHLESRPNQAVPHKPGLGDRACTRRSHNEDSRYRGAVSQTLLNSGPEIRNLDSSFSVSTIPLKSGRAALHQSSDWIDAHPIPQADTPYHE
jgi:hypothetical protein